MEITATMIFAFFVCDGETVDDNGDTGVDLSKNLKKLLTAGSLLAHHGVQSFLRS